MRLRRLAADVAVPVGFGLGWWLAGRESTEDRQARKRAAFRASLTRLDDELAKTTGRRQLCLCSVCERDRERAR